MKILASNHKHSYGGKYGITMISEIEGKIYYQHGVDQGPTDIQCYESATELLKVVPLETITNYMILTQDFVNVVIDDLVKKENFSILEYGKWKFTSIKYIKNIIDYIENYILKNELQEYTKDNLFVEPIILNFYTDEKKMSVDLSVYHFDGKEYTDINYDEVFEFNMKDLKETDIELYEYIMKVIYKGLVIDNDNPHITLYVNETLDFQDDSYKEWMVAENNLYYCVNGENYFMV